MFSNSACLSPNCYDSGLTPVNVGYELVPGAVLSAGLCAPWRSIKEMNYIKRLLIWAISAGLMVFAIYTWLSEWTTVTCLLIGFISILIIHKTETPKNAMKDILLLTIFIMITFCSYFALVLTCYYAPYVSQCGDRAKNSLLLSNFFFTGAPILVLYVFDRLPRYIHNLVQKRK